MADMWDDKEHTDTSVEIVSNDGSQRCTIELHYFALMTNSKSWRAILTMNNDKDKDASDPPAAKMQRKIYNLKIVLPDTNNNGIETAKIMFESMYKLQLPSTWDPKDIEKSVDLLTLAHQEMCTNVICLVIDWISQQIPKLKFDDNDIYQKIVNVVGKMSYISSDVTSDNITSSFENVIICIEKTVFHDGESWANDGIISMLLNFVPDIRDRIIKKYLKHIKDMLACSSDNTEIMVGLLKGYDVSVISTKQMLPLAALFEIAKPKKSSEDEMIPPVEDNRNIIQNELKYLLERFIAHWFCDLEMMLSDPESVRQKNFIELLNASGVPTEMLIGILSKESNFLKYLRFNHWGTYISMLLTFYPKLYMPKLKKIKTSDIVPCVLEYISPSQIMSLNRVLNHPPEKTILKSWHEQVKNNIIDVGLISNTGLPEPSEFADDIESNLQSISFNMQVSDHIKTVSRDFCGSRWMMTFRPDKNGVCVMCSDPFGGAFDVKIDIDGTTIPVLYDPDMSEKFHRKLNMNRITMTVSIV
jgi:hypothetical protein